MTKEEKSEVETQEEKIKFLESIDLGGLAKGVTMRNLTEKIRFTP